MLGGNRFAVYGATGHHEFAEHVLQLVNEITGLRLSFSRLSLSAFPDGEPDIYPDPPTDIEGRHVLFFCSPIKDEWQVEMQQILHGFEQFHAKSVTVIMPFLRFRRQDRLKKISEITSLRWFIKDLVHWGVNRLITCEPHSIKHTQQFCDEFGLKLHIADPTDLIAADLKGLVTSLGPANTKIYSPDLGSLDRAVALAKMLGLTVLLTPKIRHIDNTVETLTREQLDPGLLLLLEGQVTLLSGDFHEANGANIIIRDDEVSTGETSVKGARNVRDGGALRVYFVVTHPVCSGGWKRVFVPPNSPPPFDGIYFGNSRQRGLGTAHQGSTGNRITTIDLAPVVAGTLVEVLREISD